MKKLIHIFYIIVLMLFAGIYMDSNIVKAEIDKEVNGNILVNFSGSGKLYIGEDIQKIDSIVFTNKDANITEVEVSLDNKYFSSDNGILYNKDKTVLLYYPKAKKENSFTITGKTKTISEYSFYSNEYLKNIVIDSGVVYIEQSAFKKSNIESVVISDTVKDIGMSTFRECYNLKDVKWAGANIICSYTFADCHSLKNFKIPDIVETIQGNAFSGCYDLEIEIGKNIRTIENYAFTDAIKNFIIDKDNKNFIVDEGVLYTNNGKKLIAYPYGKTGEYIMPDSVEEINFEVFFKNTNLTGLTLGKGIKKFDLFNLSGCSNFEKLVLSVNTESLGLKQDDDYFYLEKFSEIIVPEENSYYKAYDGALYSSDYKILYYILTAGRNQLFINEACEKIVFEYDENQIESIGVPDSCKSFTSVDGVLYNKNVTKLVLFPGIKESYNIPATVSDISAIEKNYCTDNDNRGFIKYNTMAHNLKFITVDENNIYFTAKDNVLYNKNMTKLVLYPQKRKGEYTMPKKTSVFNAGVFGGSENLSSLVIYNDAYLALNGCTSLKKIVCNEGLKSLDICSYGEGIKVKEVYLPSTIKYLHINNLGKDTIFYGYKNTGEYTDIEEDSDNSGFIDNVNSYITRQGYKFKNLGSAPKLVKGGKAVKSGNKIKVSWRQLKAADGYRIVYKPDNNSPVDEVVIKKIKGGKKTFCTFKRNKLNGKKNIYISAYRNINGLKVYGKNLMVYVK